jgi:hypothetical protein
MSRLKRRAPVHKPPLDGILRRTVENPVVRMTAAALLEAVHHAFSAKAVMAGDVQGL